jgi:hypothetical protein
MNLEDIGRYTRRLLDESALGWSDQPKLLAQFMGFKTLVRLRNAITRGPRMNLAEQKRAAAALERILRGEIKCEQHLFGGKVVGDVIEVDDPRPLLWYPGYRCTLNVGPKGVKLAVSGLPKAQKHRILPSFRSLAWPS